MKIFKLVLFIIFFSNLAYANNTPFAKLESNFDGRIGVYALNTANNQTIEYRANERFPFCSTVKMLVAAVITKRNETDPDLLHRHVNYTQQELAAADWVSITKQHLAGGMDVAALCAPIILSIYTTRHKKDLPWDDAVIAETMRIVLNNLAQTDSCLRKELEHQHNDNGL